MAGDTWSWTRNGVVGPDGSSYPPSESWVLSYVFTGPQVITVTATTSASAYTVSVTAANTAKYQPGTYNWVAYVTLAGERHQVLSGVMVIQPNLATETGDQRSHNVIMLEQIEAAIEYLTMPVAAGGAGTIREYSVHGRMVRKEDLKTLYGMKVRYEWRVWREQNPGRAAPPILTTFGAPGGWSGLPVVINGQV